MIFGYSKLLSKNKSIFQGELNIVHAVCQQSGLLICLYFHLQKVLSLSLFPECCGSLFKMDEIQKNTKKNQK